MDNNPKVIYELGELQIYKKKKKNIHFVKSLNVKEEGMPIAIHTLEGDVTILAGNDIYIMIGVHNDIYPIPRELFESKYRVILKGTWMRLNAWQIEMVLL